MNIQFDYPENEFYEIKELLISNLSLPDNTTNNSLNDKLNELAKTSFYEYLNMITDSGMPTKVTDIVKNRIIFLIEHYFKKFPNEAEIARIFNIQVTRSRSILNSLKATHRNKLKGKIKAEIILFLNSGEDIGDNKWEFEVKSKPIIDELNELITREKPGREKFKQKVGSAGKVTLHVDSYTYLKAKYGIQ
jgi:hypothetical protein